MSFPTAIFLFLQESFNNSTHYDAFIKFYFNDHTKQQILKHRLISLNFVKVVIQS